MIPLWLKESWFLPQRSGKDIPMQGEVTDGIGWHISEDNYMHALEQIKERVPM